MKKTLAIDLSSDRLIAVAADLVEEHNYIGALKMLNKNAGLNGNDEDSLMLYAEIFDDVGLHERCVNAWFKYIDCASTDDLAEAYEGLAVSYMSLGNEHFSAFYYRQLLLDSDDVDAEMREEIINSFLSQESNPLKFVYPPKIADYSDVISEGVEKMRCGEYEEAVSEFEKVDESNDAYLSARNYIAMCKIIADKSGEAERECLSILEKYPESVQALTTLAAVKTEQKKFGQSRAIAEKLIALNPSEPEEIYKIATVCCENKMHEEAYRLFCRLDGDMRYDVNVLYFKAVSAFNSGKYEESFDAFDKILTINPAAVTARYHYERAREAAQSGKTQELSYFYRIPQEERESTLKILSALPRLSDAQMRKIVEVADISQCVLWCFDEMEGVSDGELLFLACRCAVKAGLDGLVRDALLNAFLSDGLKVRILTLLAERNEPAEFGVVVCHLYKRVNFRPVNVGKTKRRSFIRAYARLAAHFCILDPANGETFANTAEELYTKLEREERLADAADVSALAAVIYYLSGVKEPEVTRKKLASFFEANEKKIACLLGE